MVLMIFVSMAHILFNYMPARRISVMSFFFFFFFFFFCIFFFLVNFVCVMTWKFSGCTFSICIAFYVSSFINYLFELFIKRLTFA